MHRPTIGIIAAILLVASLALLPGLFGSRDLMALQSACLRVGIVMGALWLAYPQLSRLPQWLLTMTVGTAAAVAYRPRLAWLAAPLVAAYVLLRPKASKKRVSPTAPGKRETAAAGKPADR